MSIKNLDDLQNKCTQNTMSLSRMFVERDNVFQAFYEERRKVQHCAREHVKRVLDEQEMLDVGLEKLRKTHDYWCKELSKREALIEQEKQKVDEEKRKNDMQRSSIGQRTAVENALRLVEEQKKEKETALKKVHELEGQLNDKQKLEMEIVELKEKLQVVNDKLEANMEREDEALKKVRELEGKLNGKQKLETDCKKLEALIEQEKQKLYEEKRKNNMQINSLRIEQKKAAETALKLVEEEKREKEKALKKVCELERQLNGKQKLETEIKDLKAKLQTVNDVLKAKMQEIEDLAFEKSLISMREKSAFKKAVELEGQLNGKHKLEMEIKDIKAKKLLFQNDEQNEKDVNQILLTQERQSNDELQGTPKELIKVVKTYSTQVASRKRKET